MIKVIVLAVIGLLVGLGGTTGMAVMKARKVATAVQDSLAAAKADSTGSDAEHGGGSASSRDVAPKKHAADPRDHAPSAVAAGDSAAAAPAVTARADSTAPASHAVAQAGPPKPPVTQAAASLPKVSGNTSSHDSANVATAPPAPGRISKIFGAMAAKDAARVLEQMDDADVQTVLSGLNDRQAAAILAGFPPARAAAISKATLRRKGAS